MIRCAAALSTHPVPSQATGDVIADLLECGATAPDFLLVATTPEFSGAADDIISTMRAILQPEELLFVVSSGVIAAGSEVTTGAGLGLWACWCDSPERGAVRVIPLGSADRFLGEDELDVFRRSQAVVLLGDPGAEDVTSTFDEVTGVLPHREVTGGLLSAARGPVRLMDSSGFHHLSIAVSFQAASAVAVLGHGSVPISPLMTATAVVGTRLLEIDDRPALDVAKDVLSEQTPTSRVQIARDLAIALHTSNEGAIIDVHRVLGADQKMNALALTGEISPGTLVSFHRQDREGGIGGLEKALEGPRARGALFFSCSALDLGAEQDAIGDLGVLVEAIGTAAFAGVQVSTVIGRSAGQVGLRQAPLSAAIFGRDHY